MPLCVNGLRWLSSWYVRCPRGAVSWLADRDPGPSPQSAGRAGCWAAGCGLSVVARSGSGLPEEPVCGVQAGRAGARAVPRLPSRAPGTCGSSAGVGLETGVDGVADLPLQRAQRLFRGLALGDLLVVIGAALAVPVADLGDRGHVDGVVQPAVSAPAQPVDLAAAGGHLDRRGAVVRGEVVPAGEPGHVLDVADDGRGDDRADPKTSRSGWCHWPARQ